MNELYYGYPIAQERKLLMWLMGINMHTVCGSRESRSSLVEIANRVPNYDFMDVFSKDGIEEIIRISLTNRWDPKLSSLSASIYYTTLKKLNNNKLKDKMQDKTDNTYQNDDSSGDQAIVPPFFHLPK